MNRTDAILLVEEKADDIDLTIRAIQKSDIRNPIVIARAGPEALDYRVAACAKAGHHQAAVPHVVRQDLKPAKVDGIGVVRHPRAAERTRRRVVVVLTSHNPEEDILATYELGANNFVRKPINISGLVKARNTLGTCRLLPTEPPPVPHASNCSGGEVG